MSCVIVSGSSRALQRPLRESERRLCASDSLSYGLETEDWAGRGGAARSDGGGGCGDFVVLGDGSVSRARPVVVSTGATTVIGMTSEINWMKEEANGAKRATSPGKRVGERWRVQGIRNEMREP